MFLLAAARLGVPPEECVVVEDSPPGRGRGPAAGMPTLGVRRVPGIDLSAATRVVDDGLADAILAPNQSVDGRHWADKRLRTRRFAARRQSVTNGVIGSRRNRHGRARDAIPQDAAELDESLLRAISHPLRHRLLGMLDGRIASPNQLARELGLPLGRVSYHIRLLSDLGAIELVRTEPRRGALEHFYRAVTTVWFSEGDWAKLPRSARRGILGQNLQQIFTDYDRRRQRRLRPPGEPRAARAPAARRGRHGRGLGHAPRRAGPRSRAEHRDRRGATAPAPAELSVLLFERRA